MGVFVLGEGVANAINVYPEPTTGQSSARGTRRMRTLLSWSFFYWGKPDNKQGIETHFYKDNDKGYKNYVTIL